MFFPVLGYRMFRDILTVIRVRLDHTGWVRSRKKTIDTMGARRVLQYETGQHEIVLTGERNSKFKTRRLERVEGFLPLRTAGRKKREEELE